MDNKAIIKKIVKTSSASVKEIVELLKGDTDYLFYEADKIRQEYCKDEVHLRAIIEFSNYCRCDCQYCGLQRSNKNLKRYRMSIDEIAENAKMAYDAGYKTMVLQSGEDSYYDSDKISQIIKDIKSIGDIAITLSVGERDYIDYKKWRLCGADRYLLKHETADKDIYNKLHPHSSFERRIQCLKWLKELGYQTGSGFMIGLPGQTLNTIANDILLLHEYDVEMAGIGPFIPHPDTPLGNLKTGSSILTLKAVAIIRLLLKRPHLPTTTALEVSSSDNAFFAGANVIMRKVEPYKYRRLYEIYPILNLREKSIKEERREVEEYIKSIGREISSSKGDAIIIKNSEVS